MPTAPVNKEALNALVDLYLLLKRVAACYRQNDDTDDELDVFYLRGGLRSLITKYYTLSSLDPVEAGNNNEALTLERMLPKGVPGSYAEQEWNQIREAWSDLKPYGDSKEVYGTPTPAEVQEVLSRGEEILERKKQQTNLVPETGPKQRIVVTSTGVGIQGDAERYYALRGGRKKAVFKMLETYPEALSAKAWARLVGKPSTVPSVLLQQVSSDVDDINTRFKNNLQLESKLIINRNGYVLNFEELEIDNQIESP